MRAMMRGLILTLAAVTSSCGSGPSADAPARAVSFETGVCYNPCPIYRVTVSDDGVGLFEGRAETAVRGERRFTVTPAQYQALAAHLAPLRPARGDANYGIGGNCSSEATDHPTTIVEWRTDAGVQQLRFNSGCEMGRNGEFVARLARVPDMLPIAELIGARR